MDLEAEKKYPEMFEGCWEVFCPKGWVELVDGLCDQIHAKGVKINVQQIKEKFGGLRFYYTGGTDEIDELVAHTENLSYKTCQECGIVDNDKVATDGLLLFVNLVGRK